VLGTWTSIYSAAPKTRRTRGVEEKLIISTLMYYMPLQARVLMIKSEAMKMGIKSRRRYRSENESRKQ
jgi:hypothetical protein